MRPFHQPFDRSQQTTRQREGCQRRQQGGEGDNQPTGLPLLAVEVDVGIARQPLDRGGDHPADGSAVDGNGPLRAVRRHRGTRPHQHPHILVDHPELGAPAVGRHAGAGTIVVSVVLQRAQDLENKPVIIA